MPPNDPRALRAALERLASDPALRAGMGVAARRSVERDFELGRCTRRLLDCPDAMPDHARTPVRPSVAYVLQAFPRLSETYINSEIHRLEQAGLHLRLYATARAAGDRPAPAGRGPDARGAVYLPAVTSVSGVSLTVASARPETVPRPTCAPAGAGREELGEGLTLEPEAVRALAVTLRPQKTVKGKLVEKSQKDLLREARDVRHLHAHYAHGSTTVAWFASMITGLPFSFTAHAKDVYSEALNPAGLLRRKLLAARFAVTCTGANMQHLRSIAPEACVHLVYHGLNDDLRRLVEGNADRPVRNGTLRLLGVGRLVEKKGFDTFVEACAALRDRASRSRRRSPVRRPTRAACPPAHRGTRLEDAVRLVGPMSQELLREYMRAPLCLPCRDRQRPGRIPNVPSRRWRAGRRRDHGNFGDPGAGLRWRRRADRAPADARALADSMQRLHDDRARCATGAAARATVRERSTATASRGALRPVRGRDPPVSVAAMWALGRGRSTATEHPRRDRQSPTRRAKGASPSWG